MCRGLGKEKVIGSDTHYLFKNEWTISENHASDRLKPGFLVLEIGIDFHQYVTTLPVALVSHPGSR